ncbi:peptide chain release factor 3, partial [Enterococcus faecalis]
GREPLELLEVLEELFHIESYPMNWPIGMAKGLEGLYDIYNERVELYRPENNGGQRFIPLKDVDIPSDLPLHNNSVYQQVLKVFE